MPQPPAASRLRTRPPCCWARALLAAPTGTVPSPVPSCKRPTCAGGTCRHTARRSSTGLATTWAASSPVWSLDDLVGPGPDPALLTGRILRALAEEGLLADDVTEQAGPVRAPGRAAGDIDRREPEPGRPPNEVGGRYA